jgi:hypothetical protein
MMPECDASHVGAKNPAPYLLTYLHFRASVDTTAQMLYKWCAGADPRFQSTDAKYDFNATAHPSRIRSAGRVLARTARGCPS